MKKIEFLMDDRSLRNDEFVFENNMNKVKSYNSSLTSSMPYFEESYAQTDLGKTALTTQVIL